MHNQPSESLPKYTLKRIENIQRADLHADHFVSDGSGGYSQVASLAEQWSKLGIGYIETPPIPDSTHDVDLLQQMGGAGIVLVVSMSQE